MKIYCSRCRNWAKVTIWSRGVKCSKCGSEMKLK